MLNVNLFQSLLWIPTLEIFIVLYHTILLFLYNRAQQHINFVCWNVHYKIKYSCLYIGHMFMLYTNYLSILSCLEIHYILLPDIISVWCSSWCLFYKVATLTYGLQWSTQNFLGWQQCQVVHENKCIIEQTLSPSLSFWYTRIPIITSVNMVPEIDDFFIKQFVLIYQNHTRGDGISLRYTSLTKPLTWLAALQDISDILKTHKLT